MESRSISFVLLFCYSELYSMGEWNALFKLVGNWNFQPLRLTYTSILNNTRAAGDSQGPAPRVKRGLFNASRQ